MLEIRPDRPREGSHDLKTLWGRAGHMYHGCPDWLLVTASPGPGQRGQQLGPLGLSLDHSVCPSTVLGQSLDASVNPGVSGEDVDHGPKRRWAHGALLSRPRGEQARGSGETGPLPHWPLGEHSRGAPPGQDELTSGTGLCFRTCTRL